jgi:hypothetical protein
MPKPDPEKIIRIYTTAIPGTYCTENEVKTLGSTPRAEFTCETQADRKLDTGQIL